MIDNQLLSGGYLIILFHWIL